MENALKMSEAEVSLRLAFWLFEHGRAESPVEVAIDGAQVRIGETVQFDLPNFLRSHGWQKLGDSESWQCEWVRTDSQNKINIHSKPGRGDVIARLRDGITLRAESKKGPLTHNPSSPEYRLIREALGQLLTVEEVGDRDILAVAVPHSPKFEELAARWRDFPLVRRSGIQIFTVDQSGGVFGFQSESATTLPNELELLNQVLDAFRVYCGVVLLSFAKYGQGLRETIIRNFIARGMSCTQNIFAVWKAGSEQDAWILNRSLLDRLLHLHHLGETNGFSDFDEYSFISMYEAREKLLCDPDMASKVPSKLKKLQKANKSRYDQLIAKQAPRWRRPKAEDVAKNMDLEFLYKFGYDYASTHVHPMSSDGEDDFIRLITPPNDLSVPDATVVRNSILVLTILVQEALNISQMRWCAIVYDFLDQILESLRTGDMQFQLTMYKIGRAWPNFQICEPPAPRGEG